MSDTLPVDDRIHEALGEISAIDGPQIVGQANRLIAMARRAMAMRLYESARAKQPEDIRRGALAIQEIDKIDMGDDWGGG